MKNFISMILCTVFLFLTSSANATIKVSDMNIVMNDSIANALVANTSKNDTDFIKVSVAELTRSENNKKVWDEIPLSDKRDLMLTPSRMILQPGQTQSFKLIAKPNDDLKIMRLRFVPVDPSKDEEFADLIQDQKGNENISAGLKVNIAVGTLVYINPSNPKFDTLVSESKNSVLVRNDGNAVIRIDKISFCSKSGERKCEYPSTKVIIPGSSYTFDNVDNEIKFTLEEGDKRKAYKY